MESKHIIWIILFAILLFTGALSMIVKAGIEVTSEVIKAKQELTSELDKAIDDLVDENCKTFPENCELFRNSVKSARTLQEAQDLINNLDTINGK